MLTTGRQLAAARALLGLDLAALSRSSALDENVLKAMEDAGERIAAPREQVAAVEAALEKAGVELLGDGRPGVRLREPYDGADAIEVEDLTAGNDGGAG
ncbi:hypothetical protein [Methylocella sp.]|uniref:hypothetical protein n=1 Tax=Methylocella sp. TaxID=1978226 RepID=UPI0035AF36BF